jgi:hypothetical protein
MAKDKTQNLTLKKTAMLEALEKSLGIVTSAAKVVGIRRETHYAWLNEDPEYKAAVESLNDIALDFAESQLHKQIQNGNVVATIFYLKTKGKGRGYIERTELTGKDGEQLIQLPKITIAGPPNP